MKIPKTIYKIKSNIIFISGLLVFVILFGICYTPTYGLAENIDASQPLGMSEKVVKIWYEHLGFCLSICCAIILGVTVISRMLLLLTTHTTRLREGEYLLWQLCEVIAAALFCNLFLSLYMHLAFFSIMPLIILVYLSVAIYPYAFYWLFVERVDRDIRIALAGKTIAELRHGLQQGEKGIIRFADSNGSVKLIVSAEHVISIEASGNYADILYISSGKLVRYSLRNSLRAIEQICDSNKLVRCHRRYYINLNKVKLLRKEHGDLYAEMDVEGVGDIPVSKSYAADVIQRFSELVR